MEIGDGGVGRAPGGVEAGFGGAFDAEEIQAPGGGGVEGRGEAVHGDGEFGDPNLPRVIHADAAAEGAVQVLAGAMVEGEIEPHGVGADFEFEVALGIGGVRLEKDFGDVTVPEVVAAARGFGVRKDGDGTKAGAELEEEGLRGPEEADFGFALGVGIFTLPVGAEADGRGGAPLVGGWEAVGVGVLEQAGGGGGW